MNINLGNEHLAVIIKAKGAELTSAVGKQTGLEYMWNGDPSVWGKTSPVLFPIVGTLKNDAYFYEDKKYILSRHGFARDMVFEVEEQNNESVVFLLMSNVATLEKYPFDFELRLKYELCYDFLHLTYEVKNTGKDVMYFSIGGHPAFSVPLVKGSEYEDYYVEFNRVENARRWPISKEGLIENMPTDQMTNTNRLNLTRRLFQNDALVFKHLDSDGVSLKSTTHSHGLDFYFDGFPFLGIWAAKNGDFVCIEPWCGIADSVDHDQQLTMKEGIEKVGQGESWVRGWKVRFY